jgi:hypothetical protein
MVQPPLLVERRWLYRMSAEFFDFEFQTSTSKQRSDFGAQTARRLLRLVGGTPQNLADFLLHAAAVTPGTALQAGLNAVFELSNYNLSHVLMLLKLE